MHRLRGMNDMWLDINRSYLRIVPDSFGQSYRELDVVFIENVLGLKKDGDWIKLKRVNCYGLNSLAYLETEKNE